VVINTCGFMAQCQGGKVEIPLWNTSKKESWRGWIKGIVTGCLASVISPDLQKEIPQCAMEYFGTASA